MKWKIKSCSEFEESRRDEVKIGLREIGFEKQNSFQISKGFFWYE